MSDAKTRFMLLIEALVQGVTSGYVIDSTYISGEPLAFVTPLAIAIAYLVGFCHTFYMRLACVG